MKTTSTSARFFTPRRSLVATLSSLSRLLLRLTGGLRSPGGPQQHNCETERRMSDSTRRITSLSRQSFRGTPSGLRPRGYLSASRKTRACVSHRSEGEQFPTPNASVPRSPRRLETFLERSPSFEDCLAKCDFSPCTRCDRYLQPCETVLLTVPTLDRTGIENQIGRT